MIKHLPCVTCCLKASMLEVIWTKGRLVVGDASPHDVTMILTLAIEMNLHALTLQALMHLASDAVRAAAESPFLETAIGRASAVLCCLSLPPAVHDGTLLHMRSPPGDSGCSM